MTVIDLSMPLEKGMPVYPGDPEFEIEEIQTLTQNGWSMRELTLTTHLGTHVNVPSHTRTDGKNLDAFTPDAFFGPAVLYNDGMAFDRSVGVIFRDQNIDEAIATGLIASPPKFIGLPEKFPFDENLEKLLLAHDIISFENLVNVEKLPDSFTFYGVPLRISGSDGSPVRAFAIVD